MKTFSQGIHPKYSKGKTRGKAIQELPAPQRVVIPLHQHTGAACEPLVKVGDQVFEGQKIGETSKFISAPVHASISGLVKKIEPMPHPCGTDVMSVVIEAAPVANSGLPAKSYDSLAELSPDKIRKIVREAGIVGLGGAAFPTHVKLTPPEGKKIDTILVNGCECEPYITADHRLMLEKTEEIIFGARAAAMATGAQRIIIGIENNKKDAIERMKSVVRKQRDFQSAVIVLKTKYPQGGEKMLVKAVLNREVPSQGLPLDVGVVVINVGTAAAIMEAITRGSPLTKRVVTVTGPGIKEPKNLLVRVGTTFKDVIDQCGGLTETANKVIMGGPMMGISQYSQDVPVVKATSCILVLTKKQMIEEKVYPCIKCSRCVDHCPVFLLPSRLAAFSEKAKYGQFEDWGGADCIECGCCAYVCPAKIQIVQWIKLAKLKLRQMR
ncbi:MAG: electron transport complex subunit RsxC [Candidatus Margulisbacteria bacterium]|nr:electron transport complex subunit RsxC [Candidatus Margulisiibacteriota bacterium]